MNRTNVGGVVCVDFLNELCNERDKLINYLFQFNITMSLSISWYVFLADAPSPLPVRSLPLNLLSNLLPSLNRARAQAPKHNLQSIIIKLKLN